MELFNHPPPHQKKPLRLLTVYVHVLRASITRGVTDLGRITLAIRYTMPRARWPVARVAAIGRQLNGDVIGQKRGKTASGRRRCGCV